MCYNPENIYPLIGGSSSVLLRRVLKFGGKLCESQPRLQEMSNSETKLANSLSITITLCCDSQHALLLSSFFDCCHGNRSTGHVVRTGVRSSPVSFSETSQSTRRKSNRCYRVMCICLTLAPLWFMKRISEIVANIPETQSHI